ncbi:hypothetical protein Bbelb_306480 [Branchiostoma belcheri]|nr:hypothetical protein Bbelb_306480 [Branchiostoma belcheri]
MPPNPPALLAPLALDSRFCARSLRLRARTSFPVNFRKLRAPSQNHKLKTCKLADVDSDSPLFVDALGDQGRKRAAQSEAACGIRHDYKVKFKFEPAAVYRIEENLTHCPLGERCLLSNASCDRARLANYYARPLTSYNSRDLCLRKTPLLKARRTFKQGSLRLSDSDLVCHNSKPRHQNFLSLLPAYLCRHVYSRDSVSVRKAPLLKVGGTFEQGSIQAVSASV